MVVRQCVFARDLEARRLPRLIFYLVLFGLWTCASVNQYILFHNKDLGAVTDQRLLVLDCYKARTVPVQRHKARCMFDVMFMAS